MRVVGSQIRPSPPVGGRDRLADARWRATLLSCVVDSRRLGTTQFVQNLGENETGTERGAPTGRGHA